MDDTGEVRCSVLLYCDIDKSPFRHPLEFVYLILITDFNQRHSHSIHTGIQTQQRHSLFTRPCGLHRISRSLLRAR